MKYTLLCLLAGILWVSEMYAQSAIRVGAERFDAYLPKIRDKKVGLVVNHTSLVGAAHLVDTLLTRGVNIVGIYAPEHGYRGNVERGKSVATTKDSLTGITIYSIYGSRKKPSAADLKDVEIMIFDMQDVGTRYFTYVGTMHYIMEACAENNIELLVLDRPNPLGHYVAGPVLDPAFKSFIGMHPVPVVHGLTVGEYAQMINGEGWLDKGITCKLEVVKAENYTHRRLYPVPVRPSPNLPDMKSVYLYPSICLFEGTAVSEGRGTMKPFQQFGTPSYTPQKHSFVPVSIPAMSAKPQYEGQTCYGYDLSGQTLEQLQQIRDIDLSYLIEFYRKAPDKSRFFEKSFDQLAGSDQLRKQIIAGKSEAEIKQSWQPALSQFKEVRKKYLLYGE
jgi:uncharacterized protein YbbC (DUF1343 family)